MLLNEVLEKMMVFKVGSLERLEFFFFYSKEWWRKGFWGEFFLVRIVDMLRDLVLSLKERGERRFFFILK